MSFEQCNTTHTKNLIFYKILYLQLDTKILAIGNTQRGYNYDNKNTNCMSTILSHKHLTKCDHYYFFFGVVDTTTISHICYNVRCKKR